MFPLLHFKLKFNMAHLSHGTAKKYQYLRGLKIHCRDYNNNMYRKKNI